MTTASQDTDLERVAVDRSPSYDPTSKEYATETIVESTPSSDTSKISTWWRHFGGQLVADNFESRGIRRVEPSERHDTRTLGFMHVGVFWFSVNLTVVNLGLGMLGPVIFLLSFTDAALSAAFGALLGSLGAGYIATFGPRSGNRSLVFARYCMGWWPGKILVLLNVVALLGFAMLNAVFAGQVLSAVSSSGHMSIAVGIVIVCILGWVVSVFGYTFFHYYERYSWIPQIIVFAILAGVAGPHFDLSVPTYGDNATRVGSRLSFFGICFSAAVLYAPESGDYLVYYPVSSPRWKIFLAVSMGLFTSFASTLVLGVGLASGTTASANWQAAYDVSPGALLVESFRPLGGFGSFCCVVGAVGVTANMIPCTYSSGLQMQILGRWFERVPRVVWTTLITVIYMACALAGRQHFAETYANFLGLVGYWVALWIAITLEEELIFRRRSGFDWTAWNDAKKLPIGIAALTAFVVGWVGSILSMAQAWYIGPIAKTVGEFGADMGNYVGFSWAALVYPPLRFLELRWIGR